MAPRVVKRSTASSAKRGSLKPMKVSESFRAYVLEQLAGVTRLTARSMFGGVGLYSDDVFFGIVAADTLYFKVDESNKGRYDATHMPAFKPYVDRPMSMSYRQVPVAVLEDPGELAMWAKVSIDVAKSPAGSSRKSSERVAHPDHRKLQR